MTPYEEKQIDEHIAVHQRMIKMHRRRIIELTRRKAREERCMECFEFEIINESGRSSKSKE